MNVTRDRHMLPLLAGAFLIGAASGTDSVADAIAQALRTHPVLLSLMRLPMPAVRPASTTTR